MSWFTDIFSFHEVLRIVRRIEGEVIEMKFTTLITVMIIAGLVAGCTITGPKGTYSLGINGEQIGFARDLFAQLGNVYEEIKAQESALDEAKHQGKTDRIADILDKLNSLRAKQTALADKANAKLEPVVKQALDIP